MDWFQYFREPDPEDSFILRVGMLLGSLLPLIAGAVGCVQLHWAGPICLIFGIGTSWAWWVTVSRSKIRKDVILLTQSAAHAAKEVRSLQATPDQAVLYVQFTDTGFRLDFTDQVDSNNDTLVQSQGIRIAVPTKQLVFLTGITIDFREQDGQTGFTFEVPSTEPIIE